MGATFRRSRCTAGESHLRANAETSRRGSESKGGAVLHLRRVYRLHERMVNLRTDYNLRLQSAVTTSKVSVTQQSCGRIWPEMDDVTIRYVKDLLAWVEENQLRIDEAEWGSDLPSVESQLGSHRGLHQTVEDFRSKIERARADEVRRRPPADRAPADAAPPGLKGTYSENFTFLVLLYVNLGIWHVSQHKNAGKKNLTRLVVVPLSETICLSASNGITTVRVDTHIAYTTNVYVDFEARPCRESGYMALDRPPPQLDPPSLKTVR